MRQREPTVPRAMADRGTPMPSLDSLNALLTEAASLLDAAGGEVRDIPLEPTKKNVRRIAEVLTEIFDLQRQIYELRPDLKPAFLDERSKNPDSNRALGRAIIEAGRLEDKGQTDAAISVLKSYQATEQSNHHRDIAQSSIDRLGKKRRP